MRRLRLSGTALWLCLLLLGVLRPCGCISHEESGPSAPRSAPPEAHHVGSRRAPLRDVRGDSPAGVVQERDQDDFQSGKPERADLTGFGSAKVVLPGASASASSADSACAPDEVARNSTHDVRFDLDDDEYARMADEVMQEGRLHSVGSSAELLPHSAPEDQAPSAEDEDADQSRMDEGVSSGQRTQLLDALESDAARLEERLSSVRRQLAEVSNMQADQRARMGDAWLGAGAGLARLLPAAQLAALREAGTEGGEGGEGRRRFPGGAGAREARLLAVDPRDFPLGAALVEEEV